MKITREINGETVEIAMTDDEMFDAYVAKQNEYDRENVVSRVLEQLHDDDPDDMEVWIGQMETTAGKLREMISDDKVVGRIAYRLRRTLDNNDGISEMIWFAADYAIEDELGRR